MAAEDLGRASACMEGGLSTDGYVSEILMR
jgi:hypothetical protein